MTFKFPMKSMRFAAKLSALLGLGILFPQSSHGATHYHRVVWDSDPSSSAVIGFSPDGSSNSPYVSYGYSTVDSLSVGQTALEAEERDTWVTGSVPRQAFSGPGGPVSSRSPGGLGCRR